MMRSRQRCVLAALAVAPALWFAPAGGGVRAVRHPALGRRPRRRTRSRSSTRCRSRCGSWSMADRTTSACIVENASGLYEGQDEPASGTTGLLARAKGDYRRILAALYNNAYYGGEISILLAGREAADLTLDSPMPPEVPVLITRPARTAFQVRPDRDCQPAATEPAPRHRGQRRPGRGVPARPARRRRGDLRRLRRRGPPLARAEPRQGARDRAARWWPTTRPTGSTR